MNVQRIDFLGLPLDTGLSVDGVCQLLNRKGEARLVGYISPASWAVQKRNPEFAATMQQMTIIRAGGTGVSTACALLTSQPCARINFDMTSMADPFFKEAVKQGATLMLVGGEPAIDERVHDKLQKTYPDLKIIATCHGFNDIAPKIALIMQKNPDAVIVAMGTPRQENFLIALRDAGYKGMAITCGGFFDQYLLAEDYYPAWVNKLNLRFAWRLYKEPQRLWRRYLLDYPYFGWVVFKEIAQRGFVIAEKHIRRYAEEVQKHIRTLRERRQAR